jgi:DDE superfamily endonuclease
MVIKYMKKMLPLIYAAVAVAGASYVFASARTRQKIGYRGKTRVRKRRAVQSIYEELGPVYFKRSFRMSYQSFCELSDLLAPTILRVLKYKEGQGYRTGPNGRISPSARLACALRYFAGGDPYDIMLVFGIGHTDVGRSVWAVVEAINQCARLDIVFPTGHAQQHAIARGFKAKSFAQFGCCAGAVDGILIWIIRPSEAEARLSECDPGKFFCGRKHKFGLNCQAICDSRGRFLDISVMFPGSTSDVLAFEGTNIYEELKGGLLAPGTQFGLIQRFVD